MRHIFPFPPMPLQAFESWRAHPSDHRPGLPRVCTAVEAMRRRRALRDLDLRGYTRAWLPKLILN
eukprot:1820656-Rhodomonas_salina.1